MEAENWSVEVKPNDIRQVILDDGKFLKITKVSIGEAKDGKEVDDLHVYVTRRHGEKVVLGILSSKSAPEATTKAVVEPHEKIELSHGWKDGSVNISGHFVKCAEEEEEPGKPLKDLAEEKEQEECSSRKRQTKAGSSSKRKTGGMEKENWSIEVKPNEPLKVTVEDDMLIGITKVVMGEVNDGKDVEDFHVYFDRIKKGEKVEIAILSSGRAPEATTRLLLLPKEIIEFSHGWKEGIVHISGEKFKKFRVLNDDDDANFGGASKRKPKASLKDVTLVVVEEEEAHEVVGGSSKRATEAGKTEDWSIEVKPNEPLKVRVGDGTFLSITKVALGEVKDGKEVEDFPVHFEIYGEKFLLSTLSSKCPLQALEITELSHGWKDGPLVFYPNEITELSHGWKDGSVHIIGHFVKYDYEEEEKQENSKKRKRQNLTQTKQKTAAASTLSSTPPTAAEKCMEIVKCFPDFEVGSSGYTQALVLFCLNESACACFMIPKPNEAKMKFLKALLDHQTKT